MKYSKWCLFTLLTVIVPGTDSVHAANDEPLTDNWAPSEWGPEDKVGAVNRTTPEMVLAATKLVKQGKVATLGKVYAQDMPSYGARGWKLIIPRGGSSAIGPQELRGAEEIVTAELGQVGTQFDGPGHIGVRTSKGDFYYNGKDDGGSRNTLWSRAARGGTYRPGGLCLPWCVAQCRRSPGHGAASHPGAATESGRSRYYYR